MKIIILFVSLLITVLINFILFVPSSPVNLLLYLFINENHNLYLLIDMGLSNLIFFGIYALLKKAILSNVK